MRKIVLREHCPYATNGLKIYREEVVRDWAKRDKLRPKKPKNTRKK